MTDSESTVTNSRSTLIVLLFLTIGDFKLAAVQTPSALPDWRSAGRLVQTHCALLELPPRRRSNSPEARDLKHSEKSSPHIRSTSPEAGSG